MATKRLQKEVKKAETELPPGCTGAPMGEDLFSWTGSIMGPAGTPYEGGVFNISMTFPSDFPFKPPSVKFSTKIYHCNVNNDGTICLGLIKDEWSPKVGVPQIFTALVALLECCNPNDALVPEIADLYKNDQAAHDAKAKAFTAEHAK